MLSPARCDPACQIMPTIIKSASLWFSSENRRWLTAREALVLQGFLIDASTTLGQPCCSFAMPGRNERKGIHSYSFFNPDQSRRVIFGMAGNSMHINVAAVVEMFALTQVQQDQHVLSVRSMAREARLMADMLKSAAAARRAAEVETVTID